MFFNLSPTPIESKKIVREFKINGQEVIVNEFNGVLSTTIDSVFITAWKKLDWGFESAGVGFNSDLLSYVLENELKLLVTVTEGNKLYLITPDIIRKFMTENATKYSIEKMELIVLPVNIFKVLRH